MNVQPAATAPLTPDDFLRWNEGREGKREFVEGRIIEMMVGVSRNHAKLALRLGSLLLNALEGRGYDLTSADFGVRTSLGVRYPDLMVERSGGAGEDLSASEPLLLVEILSPSSYAVDFGPKAAEYTAIPSLLHYLVLSQDEPRAWLWSRTDGLFGGPEMHVGADAVLPLTGFDLTLALAEIYRGIA